MNAKLQEKNLALKPGIRPGKLPLRQIIWKQRWLFLFTIPGFIFFLIFAYAPLFGILMSFQEFDPALGFFKSPFVGLDNFKFIFSMPAFLGALRNTILISLLKISIGFPLGIIFALMINEITNMTFKRITQTITYLPYFISWVIVSGLFYKMLSIDSGLVNDILMKLGIVHEPIYFVGEKGYFYPLIILTDQWKNIGFGAIIYLAALAGINPELYEAAIVDGAGRLKRIWYISLPGMKDTIILLLILSASSLTSAGFDQLWTMMNINVREVGEILDTLILKTLTTQGIYGYGPGAAMGFFQSVTAFLLFLGANKLAKILKQESLI